MTGPSSAAPNLREAPLARKTLGVVEDLRLYPGLDARSARARPKRWQAKAWRQDGVSALAPALR